MRLIRFALTFLSLLGAGPLASGCRMASLTKPMDPFGNCPPFTMKVKGRCYCPLGTRYEKLECVGTPQSGTCGGGMASFGPPNARECYCIGKTVWNGSQCVAATIPTCGEGTEWNGSQCVAVAPTATPACGEGTQWNGSQCVAVQVAPPPVVVCAEGTRWDGAQCVTGQPPESCESIVLEKNYNPDTLRLCKGVRPRCARAVLDKGYTPDVLPYCVHAEPGCAEELMKRNYQPETLQRCVGVQPACAAALLAQGYTPDALPRCTRH